MLSQERLSQTPANLIGPPPPRGLRGSADPSNAPAKAEPCLFSQEQFRPQSRPALVCNPAGGENEKRLRQRTATIRREQTEKNATNKFEIISMY